MNNYLYIAFLINLLVNLLLIHSANALSLDHTNKRSASPHSEIKNEFLQNSYFEFEGENQILNDQRSLRDLSQTLKERIQSDDEKARDRESIRKNGSDNSATYCKKFKKDYKEWSYRNKDTFKARNEEADIPLRRITFTSKYQWDQTNQTIKSYIELKNICEKNKLEMVETRNEADFATLSGFLVGNSHIVITLGANDNNQEGTFVEADGNTPIGFQMFVKGEPNNEKGKQNCVTLIMSPEKEVGMQDSDCDNLNAHIICQSRKNSSAYEDSVENIGKETEGLDMIGDTDGRRYFSSRTQKTWEQARRYCDDEKKTLLDLSANETSNQAVYRNIIIWRTQKGLSTPTGFWTAGKFENSPNDDHFIWQSTLMDFNIKKKKEILWEWSKNEPADETGRGQEKCLDISLPTKIVANIVPQLRASNCDLPFYFVCFENVLANPSCRENGPFKMTGAHSKYLFEIEHKPVTNEKAEETCQNWDYEMAEVQSLADLIHLYNFVGENDLRERDWHLGLSDKEREGEFVEGDQRTKISFHAFSADQPDNDKNEDCVILKTQKFRLVMQDKNCSTTKAHVLCQFPKSSSCYVNSFQNLRKPQDGLIYFGETAIRRYFLSRTQKTWVEAMEYCSSRDKKLLDILFIGELQHFKNQLLLPMLIQWAKKFNAGIWTSGRFPRSAKDGRFTWETTGGTFLTDDKSINFTWAEGEPWDTTGRNMEICIELAVHFWATAKSGDELRPVLKAANCLLPNYFVCYEDAPHLKNCHLPPNVDFNFKALSETSRFIFLNVTDKLNATKRKEICQYWGLDNAEISSFGDYELVSDALDAWNASHMYFGLGLNSVGSEGHWFEGDGFTPVKFQVFGTGQPAYYNKMEPCDYVLFNKHKSPGWQMTTVQGNKLSSVLCQFKKNSACAFQDVVNYMDRKVPKNYLKFLNDARLNGVPKLMNKYYVGDSQHTWEEALRFCWSRNKQLLDLRTGNRTEVENVFKLLEEYLKASRLHSSIFRFWTSGKYVQSYNDTQFRWESVNQFMYHDVAEKELGVKMIPPPISTASNDRCVTIGVELINGKYEATLKASNCYLPYLYICYEPYDPPAEAVRITTTTPEPIVKYKELPPCKDLKDPEKKKMQQALQLMLMEVRPPGFLACDFDI